MQYRASSTICGTLGERWSVKSSSKYAQALLGEVERTCRQRDIRGGGAILRRTIGQHRKMLVNRAVVLYDGKAIREKPHDDDILVCDSCGSRQIEIQTGIDANNAEYLSDVDDDDTDCKWCCECVESQNFCTLSEYRQKMENWW